jgi:protein required for attachment to host cells
MELKNLHQHIRTLATLEETNSPVISYYLNRESNELANRVRLTERGWVLRQSLWGQACHDFEAAMNQVEEYLDHELLPEARGVAIFARVNQGPFFLPLQFRVPLLNWLNVTANPNIYHLIELKDTYHRYVVMISTEESARILEVNLGAVTEELWRERPDLRRRVGREWTREHYQNHRRAQTDRFIKEKIKVLEQLMAAGGHTHLILAGNPQMTARIRKALPKHLADKLIDTVVATPKDNISDVVAVTLSQFIDQEEQESLALVETLYHEIRTGGLALVGPDACREALERDQVDVLVLAREMPNQSLKEELVRLATRNDCQVEVVNDSAILMGYGGAGCLLRYLLPEQYIVPNRERIT